MPFQVSPGVNVSEIDLTTVVPGVSTVVGGIAGAFRWGPADKALLISSEDELVARYGKPTSHNHETFFSAASFLAYSNALYVSRALNFDSVDLLKSATISSGNTTIVVEETSLSISTGDYVIGAGIPAGATIASTSTVGSNTHIVLSQAPTASGSISVNLIPTSQVSTAIANTGVANLSSQIVKNEDHYDSVTFDTDVQWVARFPGQLGNTLRISVCDSNTAYSSTINPNDGDTSANGTPSTSIAYSVNSNTATITLSAGYDADDAYVNAMAAEITTKLSAGDYIKVGNTTIGNQYLKISSIGDLSIGSGNTATITLNFTEPYALSDASSANTINRYWEFWNIVDAAPGTSAYVSQFGNTSAKDELHVVVVDDDGKFTGVPGTVLEVFRALSRATDAKGEGGEFVYYKDAINKNSQFVWFAGHRSGAASNTALSIASSSNVKPYNQAFVGGFDGLDEGSLAIGKVMRAYDKFISAEDFDISLLLTGKSRGGTHGEQLANYLIDNLAEVRKDLVVFVSPDKNDVVNNAGGDEDQDVVQFRNSLRSSSYAVLDSGYKYAYDKYNDVYRWVPLNGDIAGLTARTERTNDAWWSPAGFNRGQIKNVVKLAWNPNQAERDALYKSNVNPVVAFPGEGVILYGDKTLLSKPSAFDRINVRRLFIVLEKAISRSAKYTLFEFNDDFTRALFVNLVTPYLRTVQGRRGITDFRVVCDATNNTGDVIDRNEFVGDIYIKPARSINFIQLNFVAVRTGVEFSEIVGQLN